MYAHAMYDLNFFNGHSVTAFVKGTANYSNTCTFVKYDMSEQHQQCVEATVVDKAPEKAWSYREYLYQKWV